MCNGPVHVPVCFVSFSSDVNAECELNMIRLGAFSPLCVVSIYAMVPLSSTFLVLCYLRLWLAAKKSQFSEA